MRPGERHYVDGNQSVAANPVEVSHEQQWQRDKTFSDHVVNYLAKEGLRHGANSLRVDQLRDSNGWLATFTNDKRIPALLNGAPGYGGFFAFSSLMQRDGEEYARTGRVVLSNPYDAFPDSSGRQSACFALIGRSEGDTQVIIARLSRDAGISLEMPVTRDELQQAVPLALIRQSDMNLAITGYSTTCSPADPAIPHSRPTVDVGHLSPAHNALLLEAELPRLIEAMPLTSS